MSFSLHTAHSLFYLLPEKDHQGQTSYFAAYLLTWLLDYAGYPLSFLTKAIFRRILEVADQGFFNRVSKNSLFEGATEQLHSLALLIDSEPFHESEEKVVSQQALAALSSSFEAFESADLPMECGMVFFWPLSVDERFVSLVQQRTVIACILIAYYCAQLHALGHYWFIGRKAHFLLAEIAASLPARLLHWIDWPKRILSIDYGQRLFEARANSP